MSSKLTGLTETITFSDSDLFYVVKDPGGSPLSRKVQSLNLQRYLPMPQSSITGLTLSNNGSDANNDIDIAAGRALAVEADYNLILTSALTKQLDAAWAVGTNQGGLDTGSKANSTWYHVWLIARVDTHVVDVLFSTSVSAPTMPANYTKKRRIGAIRTNSSGNIIAFLQYGDDFMWTSPPFLDVDTTSLSTTKTNYALSGVPSGLVVLAKINAGVTAAAIRNVYISNPNFTDLAPSTSALPLASITSDGSAAIFNSILSVYTDTSAQISARSNGASTTFRVSVIGWTDPRGKW